MTVLSEIPVQPIRQTLRWSADTITAHGGAEQRFLVGQHPRQTLGYSYLLTSEADIQIWREKLQNDLDAELDVPLWWAAVYVESLSSGASIIAGDFSLWPPMVEATQDAIITDGSSFETITYSAIGSNAITLDSGPSSSWSKAFVAPMQPGRIAGQPQFERYPEDGATMDLSIDLAVQWPLADFEFATTHDDLALVEERAVGDTFGESFSWNFGRVGFGNKFEQFTGWDRASIGQPRRFLTDDLLYWYRLLTVTRGPLNSFYMPTFRRDLVLDSQPGADATTITVSDEPVNYLSWFGSPSHKSIYLDTDAGFLAREVTDATDNGDGTIDLTIGTALPGTVVISEISFLELVRLEGEVTLEHHPRHSFIDLAVRTSQGGAASSSSSDTIADPGASGEAIFVTSEAGWSPPAGAVGPFHFETIGAGGWEDLVGSDFAASGSGGGEYAITEQSSPSWPVTVTVGSTGDPGGHSSVEDSTGTTIARANGGDAGEGGGTSGSEGAGGSGGVGDTTHSGGDGGVADSFNVGGGGGGASGWRDGAGANGQDNNGNDGGAGGSGLVASGGDGGDRDGDGPTPGDFPGAGGGGKGYSDGFDDLTAKGGDGLVIITWGKDPDYIPTGNETENFTN